MYMLFQAGNAHNIFLSQMLLSKLCKILICYFV